MDSIRRISFAVIVAFSVLVALAIAKGYIA